MKRGKRTAKHDARLYASDLAVMLINSSELRAAGFTLREVIPPALEAAARGGRRRYGAGLRQLQGMGPKRFALSADNDNEFRSRCEYIREKSFFCRSKNQNCPPKIEGIFFIKKKLSPEVLLCQGRVKNI